MLQQILAARINWLGWILLGIALDELIRAFIRLVSYKPEPFYKPDPEATKPMDIIKLEETGVDVWDEEQGRFW